MWVQIPPAVPSYKICYNQHMEEKICGTCKISKPIDNFAKKYNKRTSKCKQCHNKYYKEYWKNTDAYQKHKDRVNKNRRHGYKRHNIESLEIFITESKKCPICNINNQEVIDHNHACCQSSHSCGKCVRGYICRRCNTALGFVADDVNLLENLIKYLQRHSL